jgi:hypothetical protein
MTGPASDFDLLALLAPLRGSSYLITRVALDGFQPLTLIALWVSVAAALQCALMAARGERLPRDRRTWRRIATRFALNSTGA